MNISGNPRNDAGRPRAVAVFGGYAHESGDAVYEMAEDLGTRVAERGWTLVNGGYGGSMEAGARGARARGGEVVAVACDLFRRRPNAFNTRVVSTPDLWARIRALLDLGDAYIALPGATGTLAEIGMAWEMTCKEFIAPRPLLLLAPFWQPLYDTLVSRPGALAAAGGRVRLVQSPADAVDTLRRFWEE